MFFMIVASSSPTKNKTVFPRYFSLQRKKGENEYIIAAKVTFFIIFRLQPKFTPVSTLFSMVMPQ